MNAFHSKSIFVFVLLFASFINLSLAQKKDDREYYEIKTYKLKTKEQEATVDAFLKDAFIPALHKLGIKKVGVFKPLESDSTYGKRIVVFIAFHSLKQFAKLQEDLDGDRQFKKNGKNYIDAEYNNPPYERVESVLLRAFPKQLQMAVPALTGPRAERVYELRSYESATEKIYENKVKMFNDGDEVALFKRLGFNAVFYADVIAGPRMPNLMYMTTFANQASHDEHWATFTNDAQWKKLKDMPEYQHNVQKINIYLLRPTEYSDF